MEIFIVAFVGYVILGTWAITLAVKLDKMKKELDWWKQTLQPPF
jgi:hypothetical protein